VLARPPARIVVEDLIELCSELRYEAKRVLSEYIVTEDEVKEKIISVERIS
jgi:hypothetical protein